MIKYIILAICISIIVSQPVVLRPGICSMIPTITIGNFQVPNTKATTGYFYNCKKNTCQSFNLGKRLNVTKNFFLTLEACQAICPGRKFLLLIIILNIYR